MLNPPATAESIEHPATATITKRFPVTTETIQKINDGNHEQERWMMSTTETINKNKQKTS